MAKKDSGKQERTRKKYDLLRSTEGKAGEFEFIMTLPNERYCREVAQQIREAFKLADGDDSDWVFKTRISERIKSETGENLF